MSRYDDAVELYRQWNEKINVISRKDIDNIFEHHILHSLAISEFFSFNPGETVLDVGTGGGFPGIPLAIKFPETKFTLCDSIGKKIKVASAVAESLGLDNVTCINARAESIGEEFDYVVSRAVTSLENFYPWVRGKYRKSILYLKGGDVNEEIAVLIRRFKFNPASITVHRIDAVYDNEYFREKFVIQIEKS